jgi:cell wall assembly regulator SMI1
VSGLSEAWQKLLAELDLRAPVARACIRPGSREGAVLVERELGISLPEEVREWFTLHDGTGMTFDAMLLPGHLVLSPREAVDDTRMIHEIWSEFDDSADSGPGDQAGDVARTWLPEFVMVGSDGCGGGIFVDTRPGPAQGCVRQWDKVEADDDYGEGPVAASLVDLIRGTTTSLREGTPVLHGITAVLADGHLEWSDPGPGL